MAARRRTVRPSHRYGFLSDDGHKKLRETATKHEKKVRQEVLILRQVIQKLVPMIAGRGIKVTQRGAKAFVSTDTRTGKTTLVNIPQIPDDASDDMILAIQGFIDHECGHVLFTDWKYYLKGRDNGARIAADRGMDRSGQEKFGELMQNLYNIVEDPFVERKMCALFPGSTWNLESLYEVFLSRITKPAIEQARKELAGDPGALVEKEFNLFLVPLVRAWAGQKAYREFLTEIGGWSNPIIAALDAFVPQSLKDRVATAPSSKETGEIAQELFQIIHPPVPPSACKDGEEGDDENDGEGQGKESKSDKKSEKSKKQKGSGSGSGEKDDAEKDADEEKDDLSKSKSKSKSEEEKEPETDDNIDDDGESSSDDEGDEAGESDTDKSGDEDDEDGKDGKSDTDEDGEDGSGAEDDDDEGDEGQGDSDESQSDDDEGEAGDEDDESGSSEGEPGDQEGTGGKSQESQISGQGAPPEKSEHGGYTQDPDRMHADERKPFEGVVILPDLDLSKKIAEMITDDATREIKDADYRVYTTEWDKIETFEPIAGYDDSWLESLDNQVRHMVAPMQKDIERMMAARSRSVKVPGFRSGRLNSAALHRLRTNDDRVFRRVEVHTSKKTAVSLLVDNSGSMTGPKMQTAMAAAYALAQTLERVGVSSEVLGFTTGETTSKQLEELREEEIRIGVHFSRYDNLYIPIYKAFSERITPEVRKRFASCYARAYHASQNVDGESVGIAAGRLRARTEERKVLIVLSDGFPAGFGDTIEINASLHREVAKAEKSGIETIGIGIMSDAVKTFYPKYLVLENLSDLPVTVMGQLKSILMK